MAEQYVKQNIRRIVVDTPTGPKGFSGMSKTWHNSTVKVYTKDTFFHVGCKHVFLCEDGWKYADHLKVSDELVREDHSVAAITKIEEAPGEFMYDLLDVDGGSAYVANGFIHHNCEFLSSDALLINSLKLIQLQPQAAEFEDMGFKFWKKEEELGGAGKTYLVSVDPATGGGTDFSVIEVFEFPSLEQVAEWRSNEINIPLLYAKIKWILEKLSALKGRGRADVLWTFERNGVGEALAALYQNDDKQPEFAELYNDQPNSNKLGVYTTGKTKILACLQLKNLIEKVTDNLKIKSQVLLEELKNFVAKSGTYEAKVGAHDDTVMATTIIVRLLKRLSEYDDRAFKQVNDYVSPEESSGDQFGDEPVPMFL